MRKKRPGLLIWLFVFFLLLILLALVPQENTQDDGAGSTAELVTNQKTVDNFIKLFNTCWWDAYSFSKDYEICEVEIYMPKATHENQFSNIDDVLTALSVRQYQYNDKNLSVLVLTHDSHKIARLVSGKLTNCYSNRVNQHLIATRLRQWKETNDHEYALGERFESVETTGTNLNIPPEK